MNLPLNLPRKRLFWAIALGHLANDIFMGMGPMLLAFLNASILPLTHIQIGLTISVTRLVEALGQPLFGLRADRTGGRWLGAVGVTWSVGFFMLALVGAQTGHFWLLFLPFVLRAIGSSAFHPTGSMHAANSDLSRSASNMAYFFLMGGVGYALGPILAGSLLDAANPNIQNLFVAAFKPVYDGSVMWWGTVTPIFFLGLPVILAVGVLVLALPGPARYHADQPLPNPQHDHIEPARLPLPVKALVILSIVVMLRGLAQPGVTVFIPVLFQNKGWSPAEYGTITGLFGIAAGISGVVFGNIADRVDRRLVIMVSLVLAAPTFFLLPIMDGGWAFVMAIAAGGLTGGSHSIIVVFAQDLIPRAKGFASGAILGFIFTSGALGSLLIGVLSDIVGLNTTFQLVAIVVVLAGLLALLLPLRNPSPQTA